MRFRASRAAFADLVPAFQAVASGSGALPVLSHVRVTAREGLVEIVATDLDVTLVQRLAAEVSRDGVAVVPAKVFGEAFKAFEGDAVSVGFENGRVTLGSGGSKMKIGALPAEEFPGTPSCAEFPLELPSGALQRALDRVLPVASSSRLRVAQVQLRRGRLRAVATDFTRIGVAEEAAPGIPEDRPDLLFPARGLRTLAGMEGVLKIGNAPAAGGPATEHVGFTDGRSELYLRQAEGQGFPDCIAALPRAAGEGAVAFEADRAPLAAALRRTALLAGGKFIAAKLEWEPSVKLLGIALANPGLGSSMENLRCEPAPARPGSGDPPATGSGMVHGSVRFLSETVAVLEQFERVHVMWEPRYIMIRPAGERAGSKCLFVVSPIVQSVNSNPEGSTE